MADLPQLVEQLSSLTVMEAADLSRMLEERWGVSAAAPVIQHAEVTPQPAPVVEEQTEFTVILAGFAPDKKINVIKEIRTATGLGLKEAKEFVEKADIDKTVKADLSKSDAQAIQKRLEDAGAQIVLR